MGIIYKQIIKELLVSCEKRLKDFVDNLESLTEEQYTFFLVIISQYLYARYAEYGIDNNISFKVYPSSVYKALRGTIYAETAKELVILRNEMCHSYGSVNMLLHYREYLLNNTEFINEFLKYLLDIKKVTKSNSYMDAINTMEGK